MIPEYQRLCALDQIQLDFSRRCARRDRRGRAAAEARRAGVAGDPRKSPPSGSVRRAGARRRARRDRAGGRAESDRVNSITREDDRHLREDHFGRRTAVCREGCRRSSRPRFRRLLRLRHRRQAERSRQVRGQGRARQAFRSAHHLRRRRHAALRRPPRAEGRPYPRREHGNARISHRGARRGVPASDGARAGRRLRERAARGVRRHRARAWTRPPHLPRPQRRHHQQERAGPHHRDARHRRRRVRVIVSRRRFDHRHAYGIDRVQPLRRRPDHLSDDGRSGADADLPAHAHAIVPIVLPDTLDIESRHRHAEPGDLPHARRPGRSADRAERHGVHQQIAEPGDVDPHAEQELLRRAAGEVEVGEG